MGWETVIHNINKDGTLLLKAYLGFKGGRLIL